MTPIARIRQEILKVSQAEMAGIAKTTQPTISRWENGELEPDREQMKLIRDEALARGREWDDRWFFELPEEAA